MALPGFPNAGGSNGGEGWVQHGRVSKADLDRSGENRLPRVVSEKLAGRAADQTTELKKVGDRASKFAADRANTLNEGIDDFFERQKRDGKLVPAVPAIAPAPPKPHPKFTMRPDVDWQAERQVRAAVNVVVPPLVVREYAAPRPAPPQLDDADSPDTILWQPVIVLPADGKATFSFSLGFAPHGYEVIVAGHTADGRLGAVRQFISVQHPKTRESAFPVGPVIPAGPVPPPAPPAPVPQPMP
jgi:hypothetical protein